MLSVPFSFILLPYAAVVVGVAVMAVINIWHLIHHGATSRISFLVTMTFLTGSAGILFATWLVLQGTDWTQPIDISLPALSLTGGKLNL